MASVESGKGSFRRVSGLGAEAGEGIILANVGRDTIDRSDGQRYRD